MCVLKLCFDFVVIVVVVVLLLFGIKEYVRDGLLVEVSVESRE